MADHKNMQVTDEVMGQAAGGNEPARGAKFRVGDRVRVYDDNDIMYAYVLAVWYDENARENCYACNCVTHGDNVTKMFPESRLY